MLDVAVMDDFDDDDNDDEDAVEEDDDDEEGGCDDEDDGDTDDEGGGFSVGFCVVDSAFADAGFPTGSFAADFPSGSFAEGFPTGSLGEDFPTGSFAAGFPAAAGSLAASMTLGETPLLVWGVSESEASESACWSKVLKQFLHSDFLQAWGSNSMHTGHRACSPSSMLGRRPGLSATSHSGGQRGVRGGAEGGQRGVRATSHSGGQRRGQRGSFSIPRSPVPGWRLVQRIVFSFSLAGLVYPSFGGGRCSRVASQLA